MLKKFGMINGKKAKAVPAHGWSAILRLIQPFMPFVTEEIWRKLPGTKGRTQVSLFPMMNHGRSDSEAEGHMDAFIKNPADLEEEIKRLQTEIDKAEKEILAATKNRNNSDAISMLPTDVAAVAREKVADLTAEREKLSFRIMLEIERHMRISGLNSGIRYRFMKQGEEAKVCSLIEEVFNEFVAPDYEPEGVDDFFKFANQHALAERAGSEQVVVVAEHEAEIVGVIEMIRYDHISLLFVRRRNVGVARELIRIAEDECRKRQAGLKQITVNSSLFAEPIYCRMGFEATGPIQKINGIIFVPMARNLE
ncbi:MAG: GNAT family N-acetyltransferase [Deltaproteobacteria bacterium]|nr:GNAT family N-acetyltransferase [Deltaproteobacteria bacterium]